MKGRRNPGRGGRGGRGLGDLREAVGSERRRKKDAKDVGVAGRDDAVSWRASCRDVGARYGVTDVVDSRDDEGTGERRSVGIEGASPGREVKVSSSSSCSLSGSLRVEGMGNLKRTVAEK